LKVENINDDLEIAFFLVDDTELGYGMYMAAAMELFGRI